MSATIKCPDELKQSIIQLLTTNEFCKKLTISDD